MQFSIRISYLNINAVAQISHIYHIVQVSEMTKFKEGQTVLVNTKEIQDKKGVIRFIGKIEGKTDQYIGVQLDEACGKNNGEVDGKPYFNVQKKNDKGMYGVFVKAMSIKLVNERKTATRTTKTNIAPVQSGKNKLSNELMEQQNSELQDAKEQLEEANQRIRQIEGTDAVREIQSLKEKLKEYEDINRTLKLEVEQTKYRTDNDSEQKMKELGERLEFFKGQKESGERERFELKKKIERLEAQLEEGAEQQQMLEKLTFKIESLESKNQKLKADLEAASTQIKNNEILGGGGKSNQELQQNITTLNEMISLLQSDLNEEKEKTARLETEIETSSGRLNELVKLERKVKNKDEEIQTLKIQLQAFSDAAAFVEKLTLDLITKEQTIREQNKRLKEFAETINKFESEGSETHQMIALQSTEMEHLQDQIQKMLNQKQEQQKHITLLGDQIGKYKQKIRELSDNNSSLMMNLQDREDDNVIRNYFNVDIYQHKFYQLSKLHQSTQENFLQFQLSHAAVRHYSGIFLANLYDTLPEKFTLSLYPNLCNLLLKLTSTNHHLYLLFQLCSQALTHKSQLYTPEQQSLAGWLLMLIEQIPELFNSLLKIQLALTSADTEEDITEIVGHPELKDALSRIDTFTQELLQRIITETIDVEVSIDPYIEPIELLDELSLTVKRLPTELATRHELCVQVMKGVHQILSSIELYRRNSQARETSQVDILLQNFLKLLENYMRDCCTNPHIRLKTEMKSFISGVDLITKILKEIQLNDNLQELSSLYSDIEDIKMLKDTIMTTQFHLKELQNDLEQISYPSPLSRVHVKLPGKLWQDKLKSMKEELARFQTTRAEKVELEHTVSEQKKKIMLLEKDIKDRQVTKELYERRIGELQLKVEQGSFVESDFKRQTEKMKSMEEASKIIEDELSAQSKRKKELEEQLRKTKEKFDIFQTETMMKQKKMKSSSNLSSEDLSNLTIFKSVVAEAGALRNHTTKVKIHELNFSKLMADKKQTGQGEEGKGKGEKAQSGLSQRRSVLTDLISLKIGGGDNKCQNKETGKKEVFEQVRRKDERQLQVGKLLIRGVQSRKVCMDLNISTLVSC